MNSFDTNILLYGMNADCEEHVPALQIVERALRNPGEWIIADQVYFELYRLMRNPKVLEHPLSGKQAFEKIRFFREESGWLHCHYEGVFMDLIGKWLSKDRFSPTKVFGLVLAATLKRNGIQRLYTRNSIDFEYLNWFDVIDPIMPFLDHDGPNPP